MSVGIEAKFPVFLRNGFSEFNVLWSRMEVLPFGTTGWNQFFHDIEEVLLEVLGAPEIGVVRRFLCDHTTRGVVRIYNTNAVSNARSLYVFSDTVGYVLVRRTEKLTTDFDFAMIHAHTVLLNVQ